MQTYLLSAGETDPYLDGENRQAEIKLDSFCTTGNTVFPATTAVIEHYILCSQNEMSLMKHSLY